MPGSRHLLIPFASHGSPACREALKTLKLPKLKALLARLVPVNEDIQDPTTLSPPHERALARALGIAAADGCIPWAALEARRLGLPLAEEGFLPPPLEGCRKPHCSPLPLWERGGGRGVDEALPPVPPPLPNPSPTRGEGLSRQPLGEEENAHWGIATLCHWQVGIDDAVLGDPGALGVDAAESAALLAVAQPFFAEDGLALHASPVPGRWLARGKIFDGLATASIDRAVGHPVAQWAPLSDAARPLRRLQSEMQMLLYTERVNDERAARGALPINSFWLSGTGSLPAATAPDEAAPIAPTVPTVADALRPPALRGDGAAWAAAWQTLDAGPIAGLLADAERGAAVSLTLCGERGARRFEARRRGLAIWASWARQLFNRPSAAIALEGL